MRILILISAVLLSISIQKKEIFQESEQKNKPADVWITEQNGSSRLSKTEPVPFNINAATNADINIIKVNPQKTYQTIDGMGASLEPATCYNLSLLTPEIRRRTLESLLDSEKGIGMNQMRICIGTPDFTGEPWYSYCDHDTSEPDPELSHFSIEKDKKYIIPVLKEALLVNPDLRYFASPWSPPAWMKTSGSLIGGTLKPEYYDAYASYFVRFVRAYEAEGIPVFAVTIQNEPGVDRAQGNSKWHYPSCLWTAEKEKEFIGKHLGPAFRKAGLKTEIWCYDHNFNINPVTDGSKVFIPEKPGDAGIGYPRTIMSDLDAAAYVNAMAFHGYVGKPEGMSQIHGEFPSVPIRFTEGSVFGLGGAVELIEILKNYASSYNAWVTMLDEKRKPNNGPFTASRTMVERNSTTNEVIHNIDFYIYGHFMKFIRPGSVRVFSEGGEKTPHVAFMDPEGKIVMIIVNTGKQSADFVISYEGMLAKGTLGANSIATIRW
jgi:glucosylceramidase